MNSFTKPIVIFVFSLCLYTSVNAQNTVIGKTYVALVNSSCSEMTDGGCMVYTSHVLSFEKDSVVVSYRVKAHCTDKANEKEYEHMHDKLTKTYKWTITNNTITIKNFNVYGKYTLQDDRLICTQKMNHNDYKPLEFLEETP